MKNLKLNRTSAFWWVTLPIIAVVVLAAGVSAIITPPPVQQQIGITDISFTNLTEPDCRYCHNQNPPPEIPVDPTYLPDRHHLNVGQPIPSTSVVPNTDANGDGIPDATYECLSCHNIVWDANQGAYVIVQDFRNCLNCHQASPHHIVAQALSGDCQACHGDLIDRGLFDNNGDGIAETVNAPWIPTYQPSLVTPWPSNKPNGGQPPHSNGALAGNCNYCHDSGTSDEGFVVQNNRSNHHGTGLPGAVGCNWCHKNGNPSSTDPDKIRTCENCHGIPSVHNIQRDSGTDGINPGTELAYFGHIGNDDDCWGCHGFTSGASVAPSSGPVIPWINGLSGSSIQAGVETILTITGQAFVNGVQNPLTGEYDITLSCDVALTDDSGNQTILVPTAVTESSIDVVIPSTVAAGNYKLSAVKANKESNGVILSVTPPTTIGHVTCSNGSALIGGSGFAGYLEAADSGTSVTADVVTGVGKNGKPILSSEAGTVVLWSDTWIMAEFSACPEDGSVSVSTVFDAGQSTSDGNKGKGKGGGKNKK